VPKKLSKLMTIGYLCIWLGNRTQLSNSCMVQAIIIGHDAEMFLIMETHSGLKRVECELSTYNLGIYLSLAKNQVSSHFDKCSSADL